MSSDAKSGGACSDEDKRAGRCTDGGEPPSQGPGQIGGRRRRRKKSRRKKKSRNKRRRKKSRRRKRSRRRR